MKRKIAFTLAEVLIVLGIIGMVAQMTIPTLMSNVNNTVYPTQLKIVYSDLTQGIKMMMVDEGVESLYDVNYLYKNGGAADPKTFLNKYFKVTKDCAYTTPSPCLPAFNRSITGGATRYPVLSTYYCVILANGSSLCIQPGANDNHTSTVAYVDINGLKGPNTGGRDGFIFYIYQDGSIDELGASPDKRQSGAATANRQAYFANCKGSPYGDGCFGHLLMNSWKMDY